MKQMLENAEFIHQQAIILVVDSALLMQQAAHSESKELQSTFSRAAINNSLFMVECASNSCIQSLELPESISSEIDKFSPMAKLDYYAFSKKYPKVDASRSEYRNVMELLSLRNQIAHPKPRKGKFLIDDVFYGETKSLKIPLDRRKWDATVANLTWNTVANFLRLFFIDSCKMNAGQTTNLLAMTETKIQRIPIGSSQTISDAEYEAVVKHIPEILNVLHLMSMSELKAKIGRNGRSSKD